jgi:hypothetical protein
LEIYKETFQKKKPTTYTKGSRKEYKKEAIIKHNIPQDTNQRYICSLKTLTLFFFLQKQQNFRENILEKEQPK